MYKVRLFYDLYEQLSPEGKTYFTQQKQNPTPNEAPEEPLPTIHDLSPEDNDVIETLNTYDDATMRLALPSFI